MIWNIYRIKIQKKEWYTLIFYTGDIHGQKFGIVNLSKKFNLTENDVIVILGDAGINYYGHEKDDDIKKTCLFFNKTNRCL